MTIEAKALAAAIHADRLTHPGATDADTWQRLDRAGVAPSDLIGRALNAMAPTPPAERLVHFVQTMASLRADGLDLVERAGLAADITRGES